MSRSEAFLFAFTAAALLTASFAQADSLCESLIIYQAKEAMAQKMNADDDDIELVKYTVENWSEKSANNHGSVIVTLVHHVYSGPGGPDTYANVRMTARQLGTSPAHCEITGSAVTFAR